MTGNSHRPAGGRRDQRQYRDGWQPKVAAVLGDVIFARSSARSGEQGPRVAPASRRYDAATDLRYPGQGCSYAEPALFQVRIPDEAFAD